MRKRKICVLTGTRADYGLLYWLLKELQSDSRVELQLIVTGMHLSSEFGMTCGFIEQDGFKINEKIECLLSSDTPVAIAKSVALGVVGYAESLSRLQPDLLVLLGDRFEVMAAAQAAMLSKVPIAHLHGGESTEGLIDEAIRHSVTKMSHLHFVAAEIYRKRVIQLGEDPSRVFNVGATGVDNIRRQELYTQQQIFDLIPQLSAGAGPIFLVTYHPVTLSNRSPGEATKELFSALDDFPEARVILTKTNADTFGREINLLLEQYANKNRDRVHLSASLGQKLYLSVMSISDVVIGNSSSGIIEAPAMHVPTVNIGPRQRGRARAQSILDAEEGRGAIVAAINHALSTEFRAVTQKASQVYGQGDTAFQIKEKIVNYNLDGILFKKFYDLDFGVK